MLLGRFADAHIAELSAHDLADFEALMDIADDELFDWIAREAAPRKNHATPILHAIIEYHAERHRDR